ncbi:ArsR/SmtB family transcription factor [Demetria terragena]|uniref:ArsR/SmtB family transcription factor n=1 Tax=Demetria terragena TaxID=63959 RepID=UPI00035F6C0E|nr:metalloregulator ArsR/SmtB family transcription factor [Demetria terragena]
MARDDEERADRLFQALSDSTRRDILRRVMREEHSVSTLAELYPMSFAAVQRHVAVLERSGLLTKRRNGREQLARGEMDAVREVADTLAEFEAVWRGRIGRIEELLNETHDSQGD